MAMNIFVNIPTSDLARSKTFFEGIGWQIEPNFTDHNAACVRIDEAIYLMVLTREFFATFTDKPIVDPAAALQVETALSLDSRADVDAMIERAVAAGGVEHRTPQEMGFMYARDFEDPDGNLFSVFWMDPVAAEQGPGTVEQASSDAP